MKKRKITSVGQPLLKPDGTVLSNVRIIFVLVGETSNNPIDVFDAETGERIAGTVEVVTNNSGEFEVELFPNDKGDVVSSYFVRVNSNYVADFKAALVSGVGSVSFYNFKSLGIAPTAAEISSIQSYIDSQVATIVGPQGIQGATGAAGANGAKGDKGDTGANGIYTTVTVAGTTKTLELTDASTVQKCTSGSATTITVPPNSAVAFAIDTEIAITQFGAGQITVTVGAGVTIRSSGSALKTTEQYASATLKKIATDEWLLVGALTT